MAVVEVQIPSSCSTAAEAAAWVCSDVFKRDVIGPAMLDLIHYELPPVIDGKDAGSAKMRVANFKSPEGEVELAFSPVGSVGVSVPVAVPELREVSTLAVSRVAVAIERTITRFTGN